MKYSKILNGDWRVREEYVNLYDFMDVLKYRCDRIKKNKERFIKFYKRSKRKDQFIRRVAAKYHAKPIMVARIAKSFGLDADDMKYSSVQEFNHYMVLG